MDSLVKKLSEGNHPVEVTWKAEDKIKALKDSISLGYVHIKFTNTKGGTDLGVRLDPKTSILDKADFDNKKGNIDLVGTLTLNYVKVKCIANISLETFTGQGHLEPIDA